MEAWRYSPIEDLDLAAFGGVAKVPDDEAVAAALARLSSLGGADAVVVIGAGRLVKAEPASWLAVEEVGAAGELLRQEEEPFLSLATVLAPARVEIKVAGSETGRRVAIVMVDDGDGDASHGWLRVSCEGDVTVMLLAERRGTSLGIDAIEFEVGKGSRTQFRYYVNSSPQSVGFGHLRYRVHQDAAFDVVEVASGTGYSRLRTDGFLVGAGASTTIRSAYVAGARETAEFRTFIWHDAPRTTSDLLYKGAACSNGVSIYSGLITISSDGSGSKAFQTNRNLILSPEARAESVPNLEIKTSDVRCSHASTVGPIEEELLFYLQSKGIGREEATRALARAFFAGMQELSETEYGEIASALDAKWDR